MTNKAYWIGCLLASSVIATSTVSKADPIHEAAVQGDVEQVKQLLIGGADVNAPNPVGTPLQWALFANQTRVARLLLEYGADPNVGEPAGTPLQMAALSGNTEIVRLLLEHGGNPNRGDRSTPLIAATRKGSLEIVKLLLARGADPTFATEFGSTPLHEAAKKGELEIAHRLVDQGADVNALTAVGKPPIHFAIINQHAALAAYLKKQGAAPGKIAPITDLFASADLAQGESVTKKECVLCHSLEKGKNYNRVYGFPSLWNVLGRPRGSVSGVAYSPTFRTLGGVWTFEALNEFIARPRDVIPGTNMRFPGIADPQTRANVIAYLRSLSDNPAPFP